MAGGHGGPRTPEHPAAVSGPGALSKRTDGGPGHHSQVLSAAPGQEYGAQTDQMNQQRVAGMAGAAPLPPAAQAAQGTAGADASAPTYEGGGFNAPSARPGEPVTHGAAIGPGGGPEVLNVQAPSPMGATSGAMTQMLSQIAPTDASGVVASLLARAQQLGV